MVSTRLTSVGVQDYYDAQFSLGEAGPPGYIVLSDLDYYAAFNDSDVMQSFKNLSIGLAQLQRCGVPSQCVALPTYSFVLRQQEGKRFKGSPSFFSIY